MTLKLRKVAKHGVVTTLGFPEGQTVLVARIDERTQLVSTETPERVEEMVRLLQRPPEDRHRALAERLAGKPHTASRLPRACTRLEKDAALTAEEAERFSTPSTPRRTF